LNLFIHIILYFQLENIGLSEVRSNASLNIVGNPIQDSEAKLTFIEAGEEAVISVNYLAGKTVLQQAVAILSVASRSKGVYMVNYSGNIGKRAIAKIIKQSRYTHFSYVLTLEKL